MPTILETQPEPRQHQPLPSNARLHEATNVPYVFICNISFVLAQGKLADGRSLYQIEKPRTMPDNEPNWAKNNLSMQLAWKRYEEMKAGAKSNHESQAFSDLAFIILRVGEAVLDQIEKASGEGQQSSS